LTGKDAIQHGCQLGERGGDVLDVSGRRRGRARRGDGRKELPDRHPEAAREADEHIGARVAFTELDLSNVLVVEL
jgi:hypothetical protein